jgi:hypothetical protein
MAIKYRYDIEQNTPAWIDCRLGIVTASNINLLMTPKGEPAKNEKVRQYAFELVGQRQTWRVENTFQSFDMERGHIEEEIAKNIYSESFAEVKNCGFVLNTDYGFKLGCSPDGLVGEDGGIEIKSRKIKFQIETVAFDVVEPEYINQIQCTLLVTGRKWWDFVQYSNGMPLYVKRILPDAERHEKIINAVASFEGLCDDITRRYEVNMKNLVKTKYVEIKMDDEIDV